MRPTKWNIGTNAKWVGGLAALALALGLAPGAVAQESPASMHARVSVEIGGAVVKGDADDDWSFATVNTLILPGDTFWVEKEGIAELEFSGGSFLRLADNSKTQIAQIYPSPSVEGWTGSFYVHRLNRSLGDYVFNTPAATVDIANDSLVRIDVIGEGASTISVRFGHADVSVPGGERVRAHQGQRVFVDPGMLPSSPVPFDLSVEDDFDAWNRERVRLLVVGDEPVQAIPRTKSTPVGYNDLAAHGDWVYVDNRQYWRPTSVSDYVPYRNGYWSYVPSYGHVWIGHHPFSYVTSHYGRWTHNDHYGWLWGYQDVWGPAWVASYRYNDRYFWTPLDPYGHPVRYGHAQIHIGDFVISIGASSYAYAHLHHGHHNVHAFHDDFFHDIHHGVHHSDGYLTHTIPNNYLGINGIHAWDVFAGDLVRNIRPNLGAGLLVRDYTPRRVIRGLTSGAGGGAAVARARRLERSSGVTAFAQSNPQSVRGRAIRTGDASTRRSAHTRSAALPQTAIRDTSEAIARTQRNRGVSSTGSVRNARATRGDSGTIAPTRQRTASTNRSTNTTERTATTNRSRSRTEATPRATTRSTGLSRTTRSTESIRTPRATTAPRATTTPRSTAVRSVTLPQRTGRDRGTTMRSTRSTDSRVASSPRSTTRTTTPRATTSPRTRTPERLSSPSVRSPRVTTTTRSTAPRDSSVPRVRTPSGSSSPRVVTTPRAVQSPRTVSAPRANPSPRVTSTPRVSAPPTRNTTPRVTTAPSRNTTPRVSTPSSRSSSSPRVSSPTTRQSAPRVSAPTRQPAPRVSAPPARNSGSRVSAPTRSSAPRVSAPSRSSAPRVSAPSRSSAPRVSAPSRSSAPRVSAPSRSSAPRVSAPSRSSSSRSSSPSRASSSSSRGRSPRGR